MVAAEIAKGAWIWLGNASCHSWSEDVPTKMIKGDMVLEDRIPRDLFLRVRHGEAWIDLGGGLALDGMPDTPAAQRLQTIKSKETGDVFLERWEGEQFALQFDQRRSVFYFMTMEREPMPQQFASCPGAASLPVAPEKCLEMHCPCCGIDMGSIRPDVHMTREFGFFVLTWLLDHNELPSIWPSSANTRIEWVEAAA